jgi:hypothetical protein
MHNTRVIGKHLDWLTQFIHVFGQVDGAFGGDGGGKRASFLAAEDEMGMYGL